MIEHKRRRIRRKGRRGRGKEETQCQCKNNSIKYTQSIIYCNLIYGNNKSVSIDKDNDTTI